MGFAAAVEAIGGWADATLPLQQRLETGVREAGGAIIAAEADRAGWITAVHMPGVAAATQIMHFDLAGISVSAGAACSSGSMRQSHVPRAERKRVGMGKRGAVRLALGGGQSTTKKNKQK